MIVSYTEVEQAVGDGRITRDEADLVHGYARWRQLHAPLPEDSPVPGDDELRRLAAEQHAALAVGR